MYDSADYIHRMYRDLDMFVEYDKTHKKQKFEKKVYTKKAESKSFWDIFTL